MKKRSGFTLIEIMVVMGLTVFALAFIMANYGRSNKDSVLNREVALVMANIRYAQELTSSGRTVKHCRFYAGEKCQKDADCSSRCKDWTTNYTVDPPVSTCDEYDTKCETVIASNSPIAEQTPPGGYAVVFSCPVTNGGSWAYPSTVGIDAASGAPRAPIAYYGRVAYSIYADVLTCKQTQNLIAPYNIQGCFPLGTIPVQPDKYYQSLTMSDGIISSMNLGGTGLGLRGDTLEERYFLNKDIEVKNIKITSLKNTTSQCYLDTNNPPGPLISTKWWNGGAQIGVPNTNSLKAGSTTEYTELATVGDSQNFPIQAVIRFLPPDGRKLQINDNVASSPPPLVGGQLDATNPWVKAEIMLGIVNSKKNCRKITVKQSGEISQGTDEDCRFDTPN